MKRILWYGLRLNFIIENLCILLGGFIFGTVLFEVIMHLDSEGATTTFPMGTFIALFLLLALTLFANWQEEMQQFNLSLSMGETRRRFMISYSIQYFILTLIDWCFVYLLYNIECLRLKLMYSNLPMETIGLVFHPATFVLVPLCMLSVGLLVGGVGLKFGSNSRWVMLVCWIVLCLGMSKIGEGKLLLKFLDLPTFVYGIIAAVISLIFIAISILMMRRQRVDI